MDLSLPWWAAGRGLLIHPDDQFEEQNAENLMENEREYRRIKKNLGSFSLLPTLD